MSDGPPRVAFLGPYGTFTEQALRTQPDLAACELVPHSTVPAVLDAVTDEVAEVGFVPIENSIEGMVNFTLDALAFDHDLYITREVVLDVQLCLVGRPGTDLSRIEEIRSIPVATAQCHRFLSGVVAGARVVPAESTAAAARSLGGGDAVPGTHVAAIASRAAADRYGLSVLADGIQDHPDDQTRFVLVGRGAIPVATQHDRTALVVYQRADAPGSLIAILQEFAARRINLSNLISRPTKRGGLGNYCFIVFADGHVSDELMADAMRAVHARHADVKFFGSWSRVDVVGDANVPVDDCWRRADDWIDGLRERVSN
jgi:prephenate dehydratase